jgi:hypothetical protein
LLHRQQAARRDVLHDDLTHDATNFGENSQVDGTDHFIGRHKSVTVNKDLLPDAAGLRRSNSHSHS